MISAISSLVGGLVAVAKPLCGCVYPKIKGVIRFRSNLRKLNKEMGKLIDLGGSVKEQIDAAERSGQVAAPAVTKWLEEFENIKEEVNSIEASVESSGGECCSNPSCCLRCTLGVKVDKNLTKVRRLVAAVKFPSNSMVVENYQVKKVEHIPGPSIAGQLKASQNLRKVMNLLNDDDGANRIGIWGMGGVGKTTLVKNLNNQLEAAAASDLPFSIVMWVTVSKELDMKRLQTQLLERLNLEVKAGESMESTASRLHERLQMEKRFLLILDDVWKAIDLNYLGVPQPHELHKGHKIILTSRNLDICRLMRTDKYVKLDVLNEEESWRLFTQNVGTLARLQHIEPIARKVNKECGGLPLAIVTVGASMRGKTTKALWNDALKALQRSVPRIKGIEEDVFRPLKWSYDALFYEGMDIKSCFLYCSLYPEDFSIDVWELVQCWIADGLVHELENYEDSMNRGIALVQNLKDSCLLEKGKNLDTVRMHDVVRDVALWIASPSTSELDGCNNRSLVQSGIGLNQISVVAFSESLKRVSFMHNNISALPDCTIQCPMVSSLLLQGNLHIEIVPQEFLLGFQALNVLNLSETRIHTLPISLLQLTILRALILQRCRLLKELPPIGNLRRLEVLDCSNTNLKVLPEGMENLTNLSLLDLSQSSLTHIPTGIISQLSHLEIIDTTHSFYTWGAMSEVERGQTPFDELWRLNRLTALFINLNCHNLAFDDLSWIRRLKRFHILIAPSRFGRTSHYEKRMKRLVKEANLEKIPTDLAEEYRFSGLRSLTITDCDLKSLATVSDAKVDLLPNLEELALHRMILESISELAQHLHLRFSRLRIINVYECNRLKYLFSSTSFIPTLKNLEFITISSCEVLVELFENASSSQSSAELKELVDHATSSQRLVPRCFVPNLRIMKLKNLPKLTTLCGQHFSWNHLEKLEVIYCNLIKKLPFTTQNANTIKEIRGQSYWWNHLEWDDDDTKSSLQKYFKPYWL